MNLDARAPLIGLAPLMAMAFAGADLAPLGTRLLERASADPNDANALMDLSTILQLKGDAETALALQAQALELQPLYRLPAAGREGIRLLAIKGPGELMSNAPLEFLVQGSDVTLDTLYVAPGVTLPPRLPEHDVLMVAVAESDANRPLLRRIEGLLKSWPRPVLNAPANIARLTRDGSGALLRAAPHVVMPVTARIDRSTLARVGRGEQAMAAVLGDGDFPVIVRPVGSHAGRGLVRLDDAAAVAGYLQGTNDAELFVARFVDYRGPDGLFRKYRIVLIGGRAFACHMALSEHWMIHYLNADMAASPDKRAEEARFMADFDTDFARRHEAALGAIAACVGLDYFGIDCAETADGRLLIFEIDNAMVVHAMDPVEDFPYKQAQMHKVFAAFRALLAAAAKRPVS